MSVSSHHATGGRELAVVRTSWSSRVAIGVRVLPLLQQLLRLLQQCLCEFSLHQSPVHIVACHPPRKYIAHPL